MPSIEGTDLAGTDSGNVYGDVTSFGGGVKVDLSGPWSAAVIVDQPYGVVDDDPSGTGFPYAGTHAEPNSLGVTGLVRYELDGGFSLHGGLRAERFGAEAGLAGPGFGMLSGYEWTGDDDWGLGYVVGAAYEIPAIALRVALTYGSEIEHELEAEENFFGASTTDVTSPQSVNLDFQTGVAPKTLLFGSVRWVNWAGWSVAPQGFTAATGQPLVEFQDDAWTYKLGLGRQITDAFSAAVEISHETGRGDMMNALDPYDGYTAITVGGTWEAENGLSLTGGVAYSVLGGTEVATPFGPASFENNRALGVALKVGYRF
jgi:long-subunit fatty acid transport protein